ncbi:MAG: MFS transporter [Verrucomicrobia bacterium]|nr:MFS transporter [Verrucomicrobiota bacterium]MDA1068672.1 MFS transporter [Verrucomicrobiota bacterium]
MSSPESNITTLIDQQKMTAIQYATILICFLMNMLDGMDVLVIAFTAASISEEWGVSPQALGVVFSAALIGMTMGALFIAPQADRIGRKAIILGCAVLMGVSVFATSFAETVNQLMLLRFISGLGIGSMLASVSTLASEYAPNKSKDFWVSLVMGGYPVGAVFAGLIAAEIIPAMGWRGMFQFAGIATLVTIPLVLFFLSESLEYLVKKRPRNALKKINRILERMQIPAFNTLPHIKETAKAGSVSSLLKGELKAQTLLLWLAFFMAFATLYFLLSWIPKLTTAAGMPERLGIYSGTVFNLGSFVGIVALGGMAVKIGLRKTILIFLGSAAVLMMVFGNFSGSAMVLVMFGVIGFAMQGGFVGLYPVAARLYPAEIRTTGVGWAIGAGRLGAILGPIVAGQLVGAGFTIATNFIIFAIPCIIAGMAAMAIKSNNVS